MPETNEDPIFGMEPTGRRLKGPVSELVELKKTDDPDAQIYTAIVYDDDYHGHIALKDNVELALNFMQCPMVAGLVDMSHYDLDKALFAFATGETRTIAEVNKSFRDIGQKPEARAALEMCYLAGMAVIEAGESGPTQGVFSHGDINPHRVLVTTDGQVQLIGHGIPQVEILEWRSNADLPIREYSFKYCPPERMEGSPEDPTSDLFSLTLMAYEMITGKDLYSGDLKNVKRLASRAEGPNLLQKQKKLLPKPIREWMEIALQFDPSLRLEGKAYIAMLHEILTDESIKGDHLWEITKRCFGTQRKGRALRSAGDTQAIPRRALTPAVSGQAVRAPGGRFVAGGRRRGEGEDDGAAKAENRWGSVSRAPKRADEEETPPEEAGTSRRRRRRRGDDDEPPEEAKTSRRRRRRGDDAEEPAEDSGRRRRRRRDEDDSEDADAGTSRRRRRRTPDEGESAEETPRRRRRRASDDEETPEAKAEETAPVEEAEATPRRRARRKPKVEEPTPEAEAEAEAEAAEKAKPARRARRKPKTDAEPEAEAAPAAEEAKPRRARRKPKTEPEPEVEAEPKAKPRRRRRTPKKD